ncbi:hypothetical protein [Flavobacterium sp. XS2P14]|uniref:hypothetical protein n=1 Tax=Flavobacterium sp. XS2P14 TaxID=3401735 RepID=UPI003AACC0DE
MKKLKFSLLVVLLLSVINGYSQGSILSKTQKATIAKDLSNDLDFNRLVMTTAFLGMSLNGVNNANQSKMLKEYNSLIQNPLQNLLSRQPKLKQLSKTDVEQVVNDALVIITASTKSTNRTATALDDCLNACSNQWKRCASLGWKEYVFIGCVTAGVTAIIAADIITEGTASAAVLAEINWVKNGCAAALGITESATGAACWEDYRTCASQCRGL